jgi:nitrous oxide reductase accessory protein NosL
VCSVCSVFSVCSACSVAAHKITALPAVLAERHQDICELGMEELFGPKWEDLL